MKENNVTKIGYINRCQSKEEYHKVINILNKKLLNKHPIHTENNNNYKVLFDILNSRNRDERIKIYTANINSFGNNIDDVISNLSKIRKIQEIGIVFISENIDTTQINLDSIIKLLENIQNPTCKKAGRPLGPSNKYNIFCDYYPQMKSKVELCEQIGVSRKTIYNYIDRWKKERRK